MTRDLQAAWLSGILFTVFEEWRDKWKDHPNAGERLRSWNWALRTGIASAETADRTTTGRPHNPAGEEQVHRIAELHEIRCRRRLMDPIFLKRCGVIINIIGHPDKFPNEQNLQTRKGVLITYFATRLAAATEDVFVPVLPDAAAESSRLTGLALSGGGIRSATFAIGVLQGLATLKLLPSVDYLSLVSGGGYAGCWLAAWIKRRGMEEVAEALTPEDKSSPDSAPRKPIQFLRQFSNYLTPQLGIFSRDTWALISIYLRNMLLNLIILTAFLGSILLAPRCALWIQTHRGEELSSAWGLVAACIAGGWALACVLINLNGFSCKRPAENAPVASRTRLFRRQSTVDFSIVLPLLISATFTTGRLWQVHSELNDPLAGPDLANFPWLPSLLASLCLSALLLPLRDRIPVKGLLREAIFNLTAIAFLFPIHSLIIRLPWYSVPRWYLLTVSTALLLWYVAWRGGFWDCFIQARRTRGAVRSFLWGCWSVILLAGLASAAGLVSTFMLKGIAALLTRWEHRPWDITVFGTPLVLVDLCLVAFLFMGLLGSNFPDERREWISRLAGRMLLAALLWVALFGCAFYIPPALNAATAHLKSIKSVLATLWATVTGFAVKAAQSRNTGKNTDEKNTGTPFGETVTQIIAKVGPYVFVAGMLTAVSLGLHSLLSVLDTQNSSLPLYLLGLDNGHVWWLLLACVVVMTVLSFTVDVNEFSMHHFYRNRLVRCYLGASNDKRNADGFTGFDSRDDISLGVFAPTQTTPGIPPYLGPYPIVNTALNITTGKDLAYQERQSESFMFTPRYCGVDAQALNFGDRRKKPAYRPTVQYAYPPPGIHIGSAMAISGAAMSPNQGYHSSPATAFLLTIFNVRLGWWIGNPAEGVATYAPWAGAPWQRSSPWQGLAYLLQELAGSADDQSACVYLSDGGHFDNLGIYELVRRKCRFIIVSDAEEDQTFGFEGLGNAIRKCRADFGVEIELDLDQIRPKNNERLSAWHCVVGTVHYEHIDPTAKSGILVYMKASLTGDEPSDILEYHLRNREFPHQSTSDQFFDESQFESYRRLGFHVAMSTFSTTKDLAASQPTGALTGQALVNLQKEDFFNILRTRWFPPCPAVTAAFTRHADQFSSLQERLRTDPNLKFLHADFYPEWKELKHRGRSTLPELLAAAAHKVRHVAISSELSLPKRAAEIRSAFFFCQELIQLMENVYLDLNLERYFEHPDNRGWANLFRHWTYSDMFRVTWAITASTFGLRFGYFCWHRYELQTGILHIVPADETRLTSLEVQRRDAVRQSKYRSSPVFLLTLRTGALDNVARPGDFDFAFGFAVIHDRQIVYLRIRRHLRGVGLARRTVRELFLSHGLNRVNPAVGTPPLPSPDPLRYRKLLDSVNPGPG